MIKRILAALFALLALGAAGAGVLLSFQNMDAAPVLLQAPEAAENTVRELLEALCRGDYAGAESRLRGKPSLGMDRLPEQDLAALFYEAYLDSMSYEFLSACYATDQGVAMDVKVAALDVEALTRALGLEARLQMERRVAAAEDMAQIYDGNNEYKDSFVQEVLDQSAAAVLQRDSRLYERELTLECVFEDGQWWVLPNAALLAIAGCGIRQ